MLIYYLPQLAGKKVSVEEFQKLLEIPNVIGSKYGSTDLFTFERLMAKFPDKVFMFAHDEALAPGLTFGAKGFIGSAYNVNAKATREIITADKEKVAKLTHQYNDYIQALISKGLMQSLKAIIRLKNVNAGYTRKPFLHYEDSVIEKHAQEVIKKYIK
ncbi:N-acetylneuraminate lyase [Mycoplasmopsis synoviae]|nr:N-acetylneuraminate lyase [Mycoplasmopsis synoviae]AQU48281.1 N-acetylneuraminate lyase [Mycoplasmopsis synoviae]